VEGVCPDCGAEIELAERTARLFAGACADCGKPVTVIQAAAGGSEAVASAPIPEGGTARVEAPTPASGPPCGSCGAPLALQAGSPSKIDGSCAACGATFVYLLSRPEERERRFDRGGPPRRDGPGAGPPRSRPCRECGGPLRFSTDDDGNVTGECTSCGNRFTLPPRREFGGERGGPGGRRGPSRSFSPSYRRPGRWPRSGEGDRPRRFGPARPTFRRRESRSDGDDEDDDGRRRRRPRRE
jgi:DNA-directed RNA polymerase subunit RPC12/RpoP